MTSPRNTTLSTPLDEDLAPLVSMQQQNKDYANLRFDISLPQFLGGTLDQAQLILSILLSPTGDMMGHLTTPSPPDTKNCFPSTHRDLGHMHQRERRLASKEKRTPHPIQWEPELSIGKVRVSATQLQKLGQL